MLTLLTSGKQEKEDMTSPLRGLVWWHHHDGDVTILCLFSLLNIKILKICMSNTFGKFRVKHKHTQTQTSASTPGYPLYEDYILTYIRFLFFCTSKYGPPNTTSVQSLTPHAESYWESYVNYSQQHISINTHAHREHMFWIRRDIQPVELIIKGNFYFNYCTKTFKADF